MENYKNSRIILRQKCELIYDININYEKNGLKLNRK
jgi:hypothetical protein